MKNLKPIKAWCVFVEGENNVKWQFISAHPHKDIALDEVIIWKANKIKVKVISCFISLSKSLKYETYRDRIS